jgi:hypothetical protein
MTLFGSVWLVKAMSMRDELPATDWPEGASMPRVALMGEGGTKGVRPSRSPVGSSFDASPCEASQDGPSAA